MLERLDIIPTLLRQGANPLIFGPPGIGAATRTRELLVQMGADHLVILANAIDPSECRSFPIPTPTGTVQSKIPMARYFDEGRILVFDEMDGCSPGLIGLIQLAANEGRRSMILLHHDLARIRIHGASFHVISLT